MTPTGLASANRAQADLQQPVRHRHRIAGLTLIEMLVTLTIVSILAAMALPYAENAVRRGKEMELRQALRDIRGAIDRFHTDWEIGKIGKTVAGVSDDGYPKTLQVLVDGVEASGAKGGKAKYLRRIPRDPFADATRPVTEHWVLRGYQDDATALSWNGRDVYDIRTASQRAASDGSRYDQW